MRGAHARGGEGDLEAFQSRVQSRFRELKARRWRVSAGVSFDFTCSLAPLRRYSLPPSSSRRRPSFAGNNYRISARCAERINKIKPIVRFVCLPYKITGAPVCQPSTSGYISNCVAKEEIRKNLKRLEEGGLPRELHQFLLNLLLSLSLFSINVDK